MARAGSSSKFVPVNLNNSYGQTASLSNGGNSASSGLGRSRSFSNYGGMVSLPRSSRVASSPTSVVSRTSKLAVPRPVNLPSLRREHSGNDPTIALVGSHGSSGWNKQSGDDIVDVNVLRSDALKGDASSWANRAPAQEAPGAEKRSITGVRQSAYSPPGHVESPIHGVATVLTPVVKAVVFRGEDFPTLQAAAAPPSPSLPPVLRSRDTQQKLRDKHTGSSQEESIPLKKEPFRGDDTQESNRLADRHLQPAHPMRMQARSVFLDQGNDVERVNVNNRGPSPLRKLARTSNWADDERETLSSVRTEDKLQQGDWGERNDSVHTASGWSMDRNLETDYRRSSVRVGHQGRIDPDFSMYTANGLKTTYTKDVEFRRDYFDGGRLENTVKGDIEKSGSNGNFGRNDLLKRGWSFPATDLHPNRDTRYASPSRRPDQDGHSNGRNFFREGNSVRHDSSSRNVFSLDGRPGPQHQDGGQWHDSKFGRDAFLGRQGYPGGSVVPGSRSVKGSGLLLSGSDLKAQSGSDYKREKKVSGLYGNVRNDDPFLGDGIGGRPSVFYVSQPKSKKDSASNDGYRDPARESFEAELERVEKMLEQERQRAIEERERAIELARKEQEEQERFAREEEELRRKLEDEAREAAFRAQQEAEEAARKVEEARRAREEEKRMAELEEERRKEAARRKLLELEEKIAKRELEKRQDDALQKERGFSFRTATKDLAMDGHESWHKKNEASRDPHWKSSSSPTKLDQDEEQLSLKVPVSGSASFPSILRSPRARQYVKDEAGFSTDGVKPSQVWKKESPSDGQEPRSTQKGPLKFVHLRSDRSQLDKEEQQQAPLVRNIVALKSPARLSESRASDDADDRDWWGRDITRSVAPYAHNSDLPEFPAYGRIRQSLPRQPRVLPPPPGNTLVRKQSFQTDENHPGGSTGSTKSGEGSVNLNEGNVLLTGDTNTELSNQDALVHVSEQFDPVPSEEVVLSDAGSQFSDDTVEDVAAQAEQEPDLHLDVVSESFSDREIDELSDLSEAQESSEEGDTFKPSGDQIQDCVVECQEEARTNTSELFDEVPSREEDGLTTSPETEDQVEDGHFAQNVDSCCAEEDTSSAHLEHLVEDVPLSEDERKQAASFKELQDDKEAIRKEEEPTLEKTVHDQEMHPFLNHANFPPAAANDVGHIRHLEGLSSRQSLMQQFQQPFPLMAVPLPQSGALSHVGATLPTFSNVHTLPSQQDLPFRVQLGLMPSLPLLPNAIQIGSIQMPLHIHPQMPQLTHLHSHQQAPVFQFGQIGPSLALNQPIPMTQVLPAPLQMHNSLGQNGSMQQHSQLQLDTNATETNLKYADSGGRQSFDNVTISEASPLVSAGCGSALKGHAEIALGASSVDTSFAGNGKKEIQVSAPKTEIDIAANDAFPQFDSQAVEEVFSCKKMGAMEADDSGLADYNAMPAGRYSRGRRRSNPPRYRGILGRGRGKFPGRGGHQFTYHAPQLASENRSESMMKRFPRGKVFRRNNRRAEYRVRDPSQFFDAEAPAPDSLVGPSSNNENFKEGGSYRYVKRGLGIQNNDDSRQLDGTLSHSSEKSHVSEKIAAKPSVDHNMSAVPSKSKSFLRKYEVDNAEDAPFQTGVVRVFEQPGIETPNDKDDFIKVRSKRQLLRELRQQREKESMSKSQEGGSKDLTLKKQSKMSAKIGVAGISSVAGNGSKNSVKKRYSHGDVKSSMANSSNGTAASSSVLSGKRSLTPSKVGPAPKAMALDAEGSVGYVNEIHASEHTTTAAWGGHHSNQEVVSLTQIQLEEAMKTFRLDAPFTESRRSPDHVIPTVESALSCSSSLSVEKTVTSVKATSGPLSSLLAGEKIQFGAVTSPTRIPPENCSSSQASPLRAASSMDFGSDSPCILNRTSSFVTSFLDSHLDATYSLKRDSERKDDNYEGKVVDLEAEAAAEAAASAVVAAAISSEDLIDNHSNSRASEVNIGCTSIPAGSSVSNAICGQIQNHCASDNPIAVALPADLSVETPSSLFQASSITLSNSPGVVLQSLQGGAPTFPCLEMGPLIGGPVFNFGPREDPSISSMEPGLPGWQQRQVGAADSYYGSPSFLSPAGLSSIQGHPHMLVYTNSYTPVGQFGQLGVSFMGATYHPSGKQPDWTYMPVPASSAGALTMNDGDLNGASKGMMASQHLGGASNLIQAPRGPITPSPGMSAATSPSLFDTGFAAPFQVSQMDGLVQSHWSKAPAPPLHGGSVVGSAMSLSLSRPAMDLNGHPKVLAGHSGHLSNLMDGGDSFHQRSMKNSSSSSPFLSAVDPSAQFPDELGLGDSLPRVSNMQTNNCEPLSDANHLNSTNLMEASDVRLQCSQHPPQNSQGHLNSANGGNARDLMPISGYQEQNRSGLAAIDAQNKTVGRIGSPVIGSSAAVQSSEQRTCKPVGGDWVRGRKGSSGRVPTIERGGSLLPSKLKQIYVAKPTGDSRKLSAACS